jgi:hypothetical protein
LTWLQVNLGADEFAADPQPPHLCGLVYKGGRHLVSGVPEASKTTFAAILALETIRSGGVPALIDFESGPTSTRRLLSDLGATNAELSAVYYVEPEGPPDDNDILELEAAQVSFAVIDAAAGAYAVSGLDDNKRADAELFGRMWIDPLWMRGITTVALDHVTKNSDSRGRYAIGSERKLGRCDVHFALEPIVQLGRGRNGLIRIVTHKDRMGWLPRPRAAELELRSDPNTHAISWRFNTVTEQAEEVWRPTVLMQRVSDWLAEQTEPVSRATVEKAVSGKGEYVRQAIDALITDGCVAETAGARGAKNVALNYPFTTSSHLVPPRPDEETKYLVPRPSLTEGTRTRTSSTDEQTPRPRPVVVGDLMYPVLLADGANKGHITEDEFTSRYRLHKLLERRPPEASR